MFLKRWWANLMLFFVSVVDVDIPLPLEAHGIYYMLPHVFRMSAFKSLVRMYFQYMIV